MSESHPLPANADVPLLTAQLMHELPDGTRHVDWLIAQDRQGQRPLITFRLPGRVDALPAGCEMEAERIADHRWQYLDYEGPIEGGRGSVSRLDRGQIIAWEADAKGTAEALELDIHWDADAVDQRLRLERADFANWRLFCVRIDGRNR